MAPRAVGNSRNHAAPAPTPAAPSLTLTRRLSAPPALVFDAFTQPHRLLRWFCPRGFTVLFASVDLRAGGLWRSGMRGPDGKQFIHRGVYRTVEPPRRLVFTHAWEHDEGDIHRAGHETLVAVTLEPDGAGTKLTFEHAGFPSDAARDSHREGWGEALDHAAAYLREPGVDDAASDRELVLTKLISAPPDLVWQAWTTPGHLARWWGPRGFDTSTQQMDVRPGGEWTFTMHGPDGADYPNRVVYEQVDAPRRLVYLHTGVAGFDHVKFRVTVTLTPRGRGTELTMRLAFDTPEELDRVVVEFGADEGLRHTLARLSEQVSLLRRGVDAPVAVRRTLRAPRDVVWRAWTDPRQFRQWFGPKGFTLSHCHADVREGGDLHYCMSSAAGQEMWGKFHYLEVTPPRRLVYTQHFSDQQGGVQSPPFPGDWPLHMLTIIDFSEHDGQTTVTIQWTPIEPTDAERRTFDDNRANMNAGWSGTFEQLEAYLAAR